MSTNIEAVSDYDFVLIKDKDNLYKLKNGKTGATPFISATEVGGILSSGIAQFNSGCSIYLSADTVFPVGQPIIVKNFDKIIGGGQGTTLQLLSGINDDVMISEGFAGLTLTNSFSGVTSVTLRDFVIDGNKANNTSGYGIRKYAYHWTIEDLIVRNCATECVYSEWSTIQGGPSPDAMEEHWNNVKIQGGAMKNVTWRGPHDSHWYDVVVFRGGVSGNVAVEGLGGTYGGSVEMYGCHIWSTVSGTVALSIAGGTVLGAGIVAEGADGASGIGIQVKQGGILRATRVHVFSNTVGLDLSSQFNDVGLYSYNNVNGAVINSSFNTIHGVIADNTGVGLKLISGAGPTQGLAADLMFRNNDTAISWERTNHLGNYIRAYIDVASGQTAMSGTPDLKTNMLLIHSYNSGVQYTEGMPVNSAYPQIISNKILSGTTSIVSGSLFSGGPVKVRFDNFPHFVAYRQNAGSATGYEVAMNNTSGNETTYAQLLARVITSTQGAEDGAWEFRLTRAGTSAERMRMLQDGSLVFISGSVQGLSGQGITRYLSGAVTISGAINIIGVGTFSGATNFIGTATFSGVADHQSGKFTALSITSGLTTLSGIPMGIVGQPVASFASGYMVLSGLNWTGTTTSGATAGSGSIISGQVQTWLQINVSGVLMKVPAFNV